MAMRFRKSIKIAPGVKVNLGKKSAGISVGGKYGGVSYNTRTGARARVSAPGTGLSYSSKIGGASSGSRQNRADPGGYSAAGGTGGGTFHIPTPEQMQAQVKSARSNLFFAKFVNPCLAVVCILLGFAAPLFFILAGVLFYFSWKSKKLYAAQLPLLEQQARELPLVQSDLAALEQEEADLNRAKNAAIFFLHLGQLIEQAISVWHRAPSLFSIPSEEACREALIAAAAPDLDKIMQSEFEKTYKRLFELKTQKGIDSNIDRFQAPYNANLDKMTPEQQAALRGYLDKLRSVQLPAE